MRTKLLATAIAGGLLLVGCSAERQAHDVASRPSDARDATQATQGKTTSVAARAIAAHPDRGRLFTYGEAAPVQKGAYTWHRIAVSEAHAIRAAATGTMEVPAPDGTPIRLKYERKIDHGDGNWTWIGRPEGAQPGTEAILTFGNSAVFGTVPYKGQALQIATAGGDTFAIDTDMRRLAASAPRDVDADFLLPSVSDKQGLAAQLQASTSPAAMKRLSSASLTKQKLTPASMQSTIDLVIGYTPGFSARFGGIGGALTRLHALVDTANTAYVNSKIDGRLRLVAALQVNYPDDTSNRTTLFEVSGMNCVDDNSVPNLPGLGARCTFAGQPAALRPLATAREAFGADVVVLVRNYNAAGNGSCGLGWMNGGGQTGVDAGDAPFGFAVVSDTNGNANPDPVTMGTCRNDTLGHEVGHNLGLQHDVAAAAGANGTLEPDEYGAFPYSFGYSTAESAGNFYTVMSVRQANQSGYLVFANPRITFCGGAVCGTFDTADNARSLGQTLPIVANFRKPQVSMTGTWMRGDFNNDNRDDLVWRNRSTGQNSLWRSASSATVTTLSTVNNLSWEIVGSGDFNGDGSSDLVWRNQGGQNSIWLSGNSATKMVLPSVPLPWYIAGAGDFDGDGRSDLLWRNPKTGQNSIWRQGNAATSSAITAVTGTAWQIVGVADFDGDHRADILWRDTLGGRNSYWRSGNSAAAVTLSMVPVQAWGVAGVGDFNKDGKADILWRNFETGANSIWRSGNSATQQAVATVNNMTWAIVGTGDFDGDGAWDIVWRNLLSGQNVIWRGGVSTSVQAVTTVPAPWWTISA